MRTNGFALFRGRGARARAEEASTRIRRYSAAATIAPLEEAGEWEVLAYALEKGSPLPLVHGFTEDGRPDAVGGEFSMVERRAGGGLVARRDLLGTRPLYTDDSGSCVATDHRAFKEASRLLPNGVSLDLSTFETTRSSLPQGHCGATLDECASELARLVGEAVKSRLAGRRKVAVSFSGGLDSSLLALVASKHAEVVLCSAYAQGSRDQGYAREAAELLGLPLEATELDAAAASAELRWMDLPFQASPMDRALWCIYSATALEASEQGAEMMMLGQLADELFGGYMKYARAAGRSAAEAASMMQGDVAASGEKAFVRDEAACARFCEARFPYADERVASFAQALPLAYKIAGGERKVVLRRAALILGLPERLANGPKKAAQYSSGVAKLVS